MRTAALAPAALVLALAGCGGEETAPSGPPTTTLTVVVWPTGKNGPKNT